MVRRWGARGLTLIELLVVCAIIIILTGVVLANTNKFGGSIQIQNLAYDIALTVRQAQTYGVSVRRFNASFAHAYGVHFQKNVGTFALFGDTSDDGQYQSSEQSQLYQIQAGFSVSKICAPAAALPKDDTACDFTGVDATFRRPDPDAVIRALTGNVGTTVDSVRVYVVSPRGDTRGILIQNSGQIAVQSVE